MSDITIYEEPCERHHPAGCEGLPHGAEKPESQLPEQGGAERIKPKLSGSSVRSGTRHSQM